jgi:CheY-like chemotaxis protein
MSKSILIVDDEDMLRQGLVKAFRLKGFNVFESNNAKDALTIVKANKLDLVISDICMPEESGITLLEKIRLDFPALPIVIFITGFSEYSEEECVQKGAKSVFCKPFKMKELIAAVVEATAA